MGSPPTTPGDAGDPLDFAARPPPEPRTITLPDRLGPYRITGEIAQGGMARVVRAVHAVNGTEAALKVIPVFADDAGSAEMVARLTREARAAAEASDHPNIVGVHEVGVEHADPGSPPDTPGFCYIAMELVDGPGLDQRIARGPLPAAEAARIVARVARAVAHAHRRGFVHRDIKPGNILLDAEGAPHLADFGLTRSHDGGPRLRTLTQSGTVLGTPSYMPPEQARAQRVDARADVYALGATLYECVSGLPPFRGRSVFDIVEQVLQREPRPLRQVADLPPGLEAVIAKAMAKLPGQRYASADALAEDLDRCVDGLAVLATRDRLQRRVGSVVFRRPLLATLAGAVPILAAVVAFALWITSDDPARSAAQVAAARAASTGAEQSAQLADAYRSLARSSGKPLRLLEDAWHGVPVEPAAKAAALDRVRELVATHGAHEQLGEAWLALARFYSGDPDGGLAALRAIAAAAPVENPLPHLLLSQAHLARFARRAPMPSVSTGAAGTQVVPANLPDELLHDLDLATAAVEAARRSPAWEAVPPCAAFATLSQAAGLLRTGQYEPAAAHLARLTDDPALGSVARLLATVALLNGSRFQEAAEAAEPLAERGWEAGLRRLCAAWSALAFAQHGSGTSPDAVLERAEAVADRYVQAYPGSFESWLARSHIWTQRLAITQARGTVTGEGFERAVADADQAVKLAPNYLHVREVRAAVLSRAATARAAQHRDPVPYLEQAIEDCSAVIAARPAAAKTLALRATLHRRLGGWFALQKQDAGPHLERALADSQAALAIDATPMNLLVNARIHQELARVALQHNRPPGESAKRALERFAQAFAMVPPTPKMHADRGMTRMYALYGADSASEGGRALANAAIADFTAALKARTADADALENRGLAYEFLAQGDRKRGADPRPALHQALASLDAALALAPRRFSTRMSRCGTVRDLAEADRRLGIRTQADLDGAINTIHALLKERPKLEHLLGLHIDLHAERAFARSGEAGRQQDLDAIERACKEWMQQNPQHLEPRRRMAALFVTQNRWTEAAALYEWLVRAEPANAEWPKRLAWCRAEARGR